MTDDLVFVVDLRELARGQDARTLARVAARGTTEPHALPSPPAQEISWIAIVVGDGEPELLAIEPTRDVRWLDALARLIRVGVQLDEAPSEVARRYGGDYERAMRLPEWAEKSVRVL